MDVPEDMTPKPERFARYNIYGSTYPSVRRKARRRADIIYDGGRDWNDDITVKIIDIADRALVKPARNCDRPECSTLEKATRIWIQEEVAKCDSKATMADIRTFDVWTYAPATEQKGENNGNK